MRGQSGAWYLCTAILTGYNERDTPSQAGAPEGNPSSRVEDASPLRRGIIVIAWKVEAPADCDSPDPFNCNAPRICGIAGRSLRPQSLANGIAKQEF
jgi:hypothetical protein